MIAALTLAFALITAPQILTCDSAPWQALLASHAARYPAWEPTDAYKLLHQAHLGSEHAVPDRATAERWMTREVADLGPGPAEDLIDILGGEGRYVRVHLRSWVARGGDSRELTAAFVATANGAAPDMAGLTCGLTALATFRGGTGAAWHPDSVAKLIAGQTVSGHRAIDHSVAYTAAYHPAYRVVARELVAGLLRVPPRDR